MDKEAPSPEESATLASLGIQRLDQSKSNYFFAECDIIIPSPGIDLSLWPNFPHHKMVSELDLFALFWKGKTIAISGSVGKTTVTSALGYLLNYHGIHAVVGGNIGIGLADLLSGPDNQPSTTAVLEVSSFQLEMIKKFAPDLAIITISIPTISIVTKLFKPTCTQSRR